jgi:hypothetical protein
MENNSVEYKLGYMVGEFISVTYLPTLAVDNDSTNNSIEMSEEDTILYKKINRESLEYYKVDDYKHNVNWAKYQEFRKQMKLKYLPHTLECHINVELDSNSVDIKSGIKQSLWDSDICEYNIEPENIVIENLMFKEKWFGTIVKLKLD